MEQPNNNIQKKPVGSILENLNNKTAITCTKVPDGLFDPKTAEKHFSKFGRVQKIRLLPKKQMCVVEYEQSASAERAVLNAGAFDGFMFDVTRIKQRVRRKSKVDDDPDWLPDEDIEEELSAMSGLPVYRLSRQKPMELDLQPKARVEVKPPSKRNAVPIKQIGKNAFAPLSVGRESPVAVTSVQTTLSTTEAAEQLHQLRFKISLTPDEKWRTLDVRDRILRSWGGAGSRVKVGGATIGTCPDMCPEKELLHRQAEHQVMTLETVMDSDGELEPARAVKQYSRSSADQEIPMCYELRPPPVLLNTAAYLLRYVADTQRQVTLADWFHFMWDRFRSIRKDITQQALCCADSIWLVEVCARFHAHCAARLADLEHTQFDQKLNTDNLTKCLQTLKHMYADVGPDMKPNEAEFRGYIALLNLGDANFWWEVKQLPREILKSKSITFAIKVFTALDNNNYVRFFRLIRGEATYLEACILLRYFNDVRARALARIVKAYSLKGGYLYPAENIINTLAFESTEAMTSFINHYGLRFAKNVKECILIDRKLFIEDSDPYPASRAINLIESKRKKSVGEVISGGELPSYDVGNHPLYSSFNDDGKLKEIALIAEDLGYDTHNDTNMDIQSLKSELVNLAKRKNISSKLEIPSEPKKNIKVKPLPETFPLKGQYINLKSSKERHKQKLFSFQSPLVVSSERMKEANNNMSKTSKYTFSQPTEMKLSIVSRENPFANNISHSVTIIEPTVVDSKSVFGQINKTPNVFANSLTKSIFLPFTENKNEALTVETSNKSIFRNTRLPATTNNDIFSNKNIFSNVGSGSLFTQQQGSTENSSNIFTKSQNVSTNPSALFGSLKDSSLLTNPRDNLTNVNLSADGGLVSNVSPGSLFKSVNQNSSNYTIFKNSNIVQTASSTSVSNNLNSIPAQNINVYDFDQNSLEPIEQFRRTDEKKILMQEAEKIKQEKLLLNEQLKEQERVEQEERKKLEDLKKEQEILEKKRKQEELKKKLELEKEEELKRKAEAKRIAEERLKLFKERVETESVELFDELESSVIDETLRTISVEEINAKNKLFAYAKEFLNEICFELVNDICNAEVKAEIFRINKLMKKWFYVWKNNYIRNVNRRTVLENTPIWLPDRTPQQEAECLRILSEKSSLTNMKAIHNGYKFKGELKEISPPERYNLIHIIRSQFLKRLKQIRYPYDKCCFWKLSVISPGPSKWLYKKINIEQWITHAFSDKKKYDISNSLLYVEKKSWKSLIEFAISISMISEEKISYVTEALEGSNGILFYITDNNDNIELLKEIIKFKYTYQVIAIAIVASTDPAINKRIEQELCEWKNRNIISNFKFFLVEQSDVAESINRASKQALKWIAKYYPNPPPIEIDYLKSICQRYLGNEIWYNLKYEHRKPKGLLNLVTYYNKAVDKLSEAITNEDLFNFASFPLEFKQYLNDMSPYPKPYEFITSNVKTSDNICAIKNIMQRLKLPKPNTSNLHSISNVHEHIKKYCQQIGWFENPEQIACKVVAILSEELSNTKLPYEDFSKNYVHYDLIDILNVIVYEKIKDLHNFDNRFAIYHKHTLDEFRNMNWLRDTEDLLMESEELEYEDDIDLFIKAKRRKIHTDSMDCLMLEDKDFTMVQENIQDADNSIHTYSRYKDTMTELEMQLVEEKKKSDALENLLRSALSEEF